MTDGTVLDYMKSMGIFIICAQSFMYFTAGKTYEKYVKLLIGIMILAQFIVPVRAVFLGGDRAQVWEEIQRFKRELDTAMQDAQVEIGGGIKAGAGMKAGTGMEAGVGINVGTGAEKKALEAEIKERLANAAASYGMSVEKVELVEDASKIAVAVRQGEGGKEENGAIRVEKITVGQKTGQDIEWESGDGESAGAAPGQAKDVPEGMAEAFAKALGTDGDYIKITVLY